MIKYDINEKSYDAKDFVLRIIYESYDDETDKEIETIYQKAELFDKIVDNFYYQLQYFEELDEVECSTLKQIIDEGI